MTLCMSDMAPSQLSLLRSLAPAVASFDADDAVRLVGAVLQQPGPDLLAQVVQEAQHVVGRVREGGDCQPEAAKAAQQLWLLAAAASCALGSGTPPEASVVEAAVAWVYLPLLRLAVTQPGLPASLVQQRLADAIAACGDWCLACALVRAALASTCEPAQGDGAAAAATAAAVGRSPWQPALLQLPASVRIQLAATILEAALDAAATGSDLGGGPAVQDVLALASNESATCALRLLVRPDLSPAMQQAVARRLLPAALRAAERLGRLPECLGGLGEACR